MSRARRLLLARFYRMLKSHHTTAGTGSEDSPPDADGGKAREVMGSNRREENKSTEINSFSVSTSHLEFDSFLRSIICNLTDENSSKE